MQESERQQHNKATMRRVFDEIVNARQFHLVDELLAEDFIYQTPGGEEFRGREGFRELLSIYTTAFPDMHVTLESMVAEGDLVASHYTIRGTHEGNLMDLPPTGQRAAIPAVIMSRFRDGKLAEEFEVIDSLDLLQQLGAAPPSGEQAPGPGDRLGL